jgi:hypothetical protein
MHALVADAVSEGRDVIRGMLIVGLVFIGVIAIGTLSHYLRSRRRARKRRREPIY